MPVDSNIFQQYLQAPKSVVDYSNDYAKADALRTTNALQALNLQQQTDTTAQALAERNALRRIAATAGGDRQTLITGLRNSGMPGLMTQADSLEQSGAKLKESEATAAMHNATAGKTTQDTQIAGHAQHLQALSTVNSPQDAMQWIVDGVRSGSLPAAGLQPALDRLQQASANPEAFAKWKQETQAAGLSVQQQFEQVAPKPTEMRLGNVVKTIDMNPRSPSFGKEIVGQQAIGTSPDTVANNATSRANNAATIAGENERQGKTLAKDYAVNGFNPDGTPGTTNDAMIDAIGQYKVAPPNGMALRNPRMQQILAQVAEKYPDFDATQFSARQGAARSFSTGKDGQNVQAANTALNHLDTVEQLALAQKNGNLVLFNKLANQIAANSGQPAPTTLKAAISMVAPELTKAVVGSGGGVGERADFAHNLNPDGSPAQILQGIGAIKELMGGRLSEVERTYSRTTGRKDFRDSFLSPAAQKILAARAAAADPSGSSAATVAGLPDASAIDAELRRRAGGK
jgi:hypothetical protein